ncbi:MAG: transposase [Blastocatellia bacterium]|nr:transposase [Blastocatellia bacterium]
MLEQLKAQAQRLPSEKQDATLRKWIDEKLDAGSGACILRESQAAVCVLENWQRFARERYDLIAWVVMPNHVHVLIRVYEGAPLAKIIQSWKSYTGKRIAAMIEERALRVGDPHTLRPRFEQVWMRDYWDRYIRDEKHFAAVVAYIHRNPVKAGLVERAEDWPWSSARDYWEQGDTWDGR